VVDDETLRRDLMAHARRRLGPAYRTREIVVRDELPHTRSGKIMRRLLKARELGLPSRRFGVRTMSYRNWLK
jgi:acetyl-CoA synthetase